MEFIARKNTKIKILLTRNRVWIFADGEPMADLDKRLLEEDGEEAVKEMLAEFTIRAQSNKCYQDKSICQE